MKTKIPSGRVALALAVLVGLATGSLAAQQSGELLVSVVDIDGNPTPDADIRVIGLGRVVHIEPGAVARFQNVPVGDWLIEATSARSGRGVTRTTVTGGATVEVEITVSLFFHGDDIVVSVGAEGTQSELYSPSNVIRGVDLRAAAQASLGETLADEPGVNSSYHGPGSSRPVIRGLGGERVRVLESGVGTGDASNTSPDHAPGVEAMTADRIEIIRGPATLLYGSSALGGVVNIEDGRIPRELPAHPVTGSFTARGGTVADERNVAARLDGATGNVAYHVSGLFRSTDDYAIPGVAGVLTNSAVETTRFAGGLSYVGDNGFIGASFSGYDTEYGVPGRRGAAGESGEGGPAEEGEPGIDLRQRRIDLEAGWRVGGDFVKGLKVRFGIADYQHLEVISTPDAPQTIETRFFNNEWEGRLEVEHTLGELTNGAFGTQVRSRDFEAIGEEVFVPPTTTIQLAAFLFEQFDLGWLGVQVGARIESQTTENVTTGSSRDDTGVSISVGAVTRVSDAVSLVVNGARSTKLPSAEELFSNGPHLATLQFELGRSDLRQEVGYSFDFGVRVSQGRVRGELSLFVNAFDRFTYQAMTGGTQDGLPISQWSQADAVFRGFEVQTDIELFHYGNGHFVLDAFADHVRAELTASNQPLPRIPPLRFGSGLGYESTSWHGHAGVTRVTNQDRLAVLEVETAGYTLVNASVGYRLFKGRTSHDIVLSGRNLTDQVARSHISFLKEFVPLPGREIRLTYQLSF